ncbi:MAG: dicarboxylate/amino acid:cation symporter [Holosporales bacterium]|jgi:proton glutamate symport protein|nr:dicarboxylate/amino acid:cation symporter [Holosporales bacterium]
MSILSKILNSGITTIVAAILAMSVGILFPSVGSKFKPISNIFLTLISVSVIPIVFSSVTCSIVQIITKKEREIKIRDIVLTFLGILVIAGIIGILTSALLNPAHDISNSATISNLIMADMQKSITELSVDDSLNLLHKAGFSDFMITLLPGNLFKAFADGNIIQILAISILVGIAVSKLDKNTQISVTSSLEVMTRSFKKILAIPTKILPIGLFTLLASNLSKVKLNDLLAMKHFCLCTLVGFFIITLVSCLILRIYSPIGFKNSMSALKEIIVIAFSTCSNQATLPFLTAALHNRFRLQEDAINFAIPLGVTMCRVGNVLYYAFIAIFIASIYHEPLGIYQYCFIVIGSILTSFAASGASGVIAISMISIVLDPLNLRIDSILAILIIVDPILDPFRTVTSLVMNAALSCFIINNKRKKEKCE